MMSVKRGLPGLESRSVSFPRFCKGSSLIKVGPQESSYRAGSFKNILSEIKAEANSGSHDSPSQRNSAPRQYSQDAYNNGRVIRSER